MQPALLPRALAPALLACLLTLSAAAQQRPLTSQRPEAAKTAPEHASYAPAPALARDVPVAARTAAPDLATPPAPPALLAALAHGPDRARVHWDEPGDGSLWARGAHYKMSFDARGATYYPLFGAGQQQHLPLALSPAAVTLGAAPLAFERTARAVRSGDRIEIDRGAFVEVYELGPRTIEQLFVVASLPRAGELVLEIPFADALAEGLASGFEASETPEGLVLDSAAGRVVYGRAVAVERDGRRSDAATTLAGQSVTIQLADDFLRDAAFPLVVDPIVSVVPIDTTSLPDVNPDTAYDAQTQRWLVVFEERTTPTDSDVYYSMCNASGIPMWGGYVDLTTVSWKTPKCANLYWATQFLAVAATTEGTTASIRGRTIEADISAMGSQFAISAGAETGAKLDPTVGGDPFFESNAFYCVAWERVYSGSDHDIHVRLVAANSGLGALNLFSDSGGTIDTKPHLSRSNGASTWTLVFQRQVGQLSSIWGGRIHYDGQVASWPFQITSDHEDLNACVSSPLYGSQRTLVVYQRLGIANYDLEGTLLDGATVLGTTNLSSLMGASSVRHETWPSVDSDGLHFGVTWGESQFLSSGAYDVYCAEFYMSGNTLGLSQGRIPLATSADYEHFPHIASAQGSAGPFRRFMATWGRSSGAISGDVYAGLIDGNVGGSAVPYCLGDGSGAACPCGNNGAPGNGCGHSHNPAGARLALSGTPATTTWYDTAVLTGSGLPGATLCVFMQSMTANAPAPFSDGVGCLAADVIRLATRSAAMGSVSFPDASLGDPFLHQASGLGLDGGRRTYQLWFRNSPSFCTSAPSNITNGLIVDWAR